jgi:hypothetical protein
MAGCLMIKTPKQAVPIERFIIGGASSGLPTASIAQFKCLTKEVYRDNSTVIILYYDVGPLPHPD